jgi:hypothetical protein
LVVWLCDTSVAHERREGVLVNRRPAAEAWQLNVQALEEQFEGEQGWIVG